MRNISEIKPFEDEFEVFDLPAVRIIGKEARCGGALGNTAPALAAETLKPETWNILMQLPLVLKDGLGFTCDYDKETDTFSYLVSVMTPAGTPVPEGFSFRDVPATCCAKGLFGEGVTQTIVRAREMGYVTNWEPYGWNAEFYVQEEEENPPKTECPTCHWLVPVRKG